MANDEKTYADYIQFSKNGTKYYFEDSEARSEITNLKENVGDISDIQSKLDQKADKDTVDKLTEKVNQNTNDINSLKNSTGGSEGMIWFEGASPITDLTIGIGNFKEKFTVLYSDVAGLTHNGKTTLKWDKPDGYVPLERQPAIGLNSANSENDLLVYAFVQPAGSQDGHHIYQATISFTKIGKDEAVVIGSYEPIFYGYKGKESEL